MSNEFMQAAASYFGLGETKPRRSELFTDGGELVAVFEVVVTPDDLVGVLERMKAMQAAQRQPQATQEPSVSREDMRAAYNALAPAERSAMGSFAKYVALYGGNDPYTVGRVFG